MNERLALRPATPSDGALLRRVYAATRAEELALLDWDEAQQAAFVAMQFEAQDRHLRLAYPNLTFDVIELDGEAIGRLYVDRGSAELRLVDITLLPEHRRQGVGTTMVDRLQAEAAACGQPLMLHVVVTNPARRLYERLGFTPLEVQGVHQEMVWRPPGQPNTAS